MKILSSAVGLLVVCFLLLSTGTYFTSCQKEPITDTVIIKDTIHVRDTVRIVDSSTCSCYDLKDGLVAYYNFDNGSLKDSSGNNNHIIFNNAVKTADRFGKPNNAYLFNGTSSYMQVTNSATLSPANITMVATIKLNGFYGGDNHVNQIFKKGFKDQDQGIYGLRVLPTTGGCCTMVDTSKEVVYGYYGDYGSTISVYPTNGNYVRTNKWINFAVTYDGYVLKIYVDGQFVNATVGTPVYTPDTNDLFIGRAENPAFPYWFNGIIDEIRIYNKALCEGAIKQLSDSKQ